MSARRPFLLVVFLLGAVLLGCDTTATNPETQVVVEAYLQAKAPLPTIQLRRTVDIDEAYNPREVAVRNAEVTVEHQSEDSAATTTTYTENDTLPGVYEPQDPPVVQPQGTYRLNVTTDDGSTITSSTTVPGPVEVANTENDTSVYQSPQQPSITIAVPERAERQNVFTFTTTSLLDFASTPDSVLAGKLTPFYADGFNADEDSLESLRITSSGLLNEGNFSRNEAEGTITIDLPWLAVAFYCQNEAAVNVVDDNYYDFLRSQQVQQNGLAPGEIPNVIEHIEGGTGLFGSYARAPNKIFVQPPNSASVSCPAGP